MELLHGCVYAPCRFGYAFLKMTWFVNLLLGLIFVLAAFRPAMALALIVLMLPLEQLIQSLNPVLLTSRTGLLAVNATTAAVAAIALTRVFLARMRPFQSFLTPTLAGSLLLLLWSSVTVLWTPSPNAVPAILSGLPYMVLALSVSQALLTDMDTAENSLRMILLVGTILCGLIILNPEFQTRWGRLGFDLGGGIRSSALSLGEAGGITLMVGLLLRHNQGWASPLWNLLRLLGVLTGLYVGIQSGSRGQVLFAIAVAAAFYPFAAPIADVRRLVLSILGLTFLAVSTLVLLSSLLYGFDAQRFSVDELLYGRSSTEGRIQNVLVLLNAWASQPFAWLFGLGFFAFNSLYSGQLDPYSHVVVADLLFEHGLIGASIGAFILWTSTYSFIALFRIYGGSPAHRAVVVTFLALATYTFLLSNKQGHLWGISSTFFFLCAGGRLLARAPENPEMEDWLQDDHVKRLDGADPHHSHGEQPRMGPAK